MSGIDRLISQGRMDDAMIKPLEDVEHLLSKYLEMFDKGEISCQKLLEVLNPTFLKLSKHLNSLAASPSISRCCAEKAYTCWVNALFGTLDTADPKPGCLRLAKVVELQREVFNYKGLPEVGLVGIMYSSKPQEVP